MYTNGSDYLACGIWIQKMIGKIETIYLKKTLLDSAYLKVKEKKTVQLQTQQALDLFVKTLV